MSFSDKEAAHEQPEGVGLRGAEGGRSTSKGRGNQRRDGRIRRHDLVSHLGEERFHHQKHKMSFFGALRIWVMSSM